MNSETGKSHEANSSLPFRPSLFCNIKQLPDGKFEVTAPGLIDQERELISGATRFICDSREEAEDELASVSGWASESLEQLSLSKSHGVYFTIDRLPDGRYKVMIPGAQLANSCFRIGTSRDFDTWSEAMEYYLQMRHEFETVILKNPILEIQVSSNERIAFSDYDSYKPFVAPAKEPSQIPTMTEKYILDDEKQDQQLKSARTYKNTVQESGWERKLYSFIGSYVNGEGSGLLEELKIERLDAVTPKQAMDLSTHVVLDLTKYLKKYDEDDENPTDDKTVLAMLLEGLAKRDDENWNGNGVCRNFASGVKAVFEALKANQTRFSRLYNTYCLYDAALDSVYKPSREDHRTHSLELGSGHAWNTFVTVSQKGETSATIADITWAKRDLKTKEVKGIDHTLTRMEPLVFAMAQETDGEIEVRKALAYYGFKINHTQSKENEKWFFASQAMNLIRQHKIFTDLPVELVEGLSSEYKKHPAEIDRREVEAMWKISKQADRFDFDSILAVYLADASAFTAHFRAFGYMVDVELQRKVFEWMERHYRNFEEYLENKTDCRVRMREVMPEKLPVFSPPERESDAKELISLINRSQFFTYSSSLRPHDCTDERMSKIFAKAKSILRELNPLAYDETVKDMSDYDIVKRFDNLYKTLRT